MALHATETAARAAFARGQVLGGDFYARSTVEVARDLLGKVLAHGPAAGRIVEVEAYLPRNDRAAHAWRGLTPRTRVLFGPGGRAYVFLIYGVHHCLNLVAEAEGTPGCVLIRALEPIAGIGWMRRRRPGISGITELASGPGNLTRAMGIDGSHNGVDVTRGPLTVRALPFEPAFEIRTGTRVGIRFDRNLPLRFFIAGNGSVSHAGRLC